MSTLDRIRTERIVAILRHVGHVESVVDALVAGGIRVVEVTLDSAGAYASITTLRERGDVTVLAGTVLEPGEVDRAVAAGAEACVSPVFRPEILTRCLRRETLAIPGALTVTEVEAARRAGAVLVKLFPAGRLGPQYVRDLLIPLAGVELLATGGVDARNAAEFLRAGAVAVGAGGALVGADDVEKAARELVSAVSTASQ